MSKCVHAIDEMIFLGCRINGGPFEEDKPLMATHGSHDLEDEDAEDLGADEEEAEEASNTPGKVEGEALHSSLCDDIPEEMDLRGPKDLTLNCKTSPRR